jgi:tetratricopeptide (TPR) repeat protein
MSGLTIDQALQKAIAAHKAGQVQEADRLYTAILKAQSKHPDANHNMGVLGVSVGKVEQAIPFFQTALVSNPASTQFWLSYIDAMIKLEKIDIARSIFFQAKSKGIKGDGFDQLEERLNSSSKAPNKSTAKGQETRQVQPNILDTIKLNQAINLAKKKSKEGSLEEARRIYQDILTKFPKNKRARDGLKKFKSDILPKVSSIEEPSQAQLQSLIQLYRQGQFQQTLEKTEVLSQQFPTSSTLYKLKAVSLRGLGQVGRSIEAYQMALTITPLDAESHFNIGNAFQALGKFNEALNAYEKALELTPHDATIYTNIGVALKELGRLERAIVAFNKAIQIRPNFADAFYNLGLALQDQEKLEAAIEAYNKAVQINPNFAHAYNNQGAAHRDLGNLEKAMEAYNKAFQIKPNYAELHNNIGVAFQDQGKMEEAKAAFNKAIVCKPDFSVAHLHLSSVTRYQTDHPHISTVTALLKSSTLELKDRCYLTYAYAKMNEDLTNLDIAFENYATGGAMRKKLLAYDFAYDEHLFALIKNAASNLNQFVFKNDVKLAEHTPVFILGMPRSGTTLVEQIVSSHPDINGAGELDYLPNFGYDLMRGFKPAEADAMYEFRNNYLNAISKRANGRSLVTDKLPLNFRYIALICAALPEAKIIHVHRNAKATCWSNFKHCFATNGLGFSYTLEDTVNYYRLYQDLMDFWSQMYGNRIYDCNYDGLTENQEAETRSLINYLDLNWEKACLAPQDNKRSVKTASQGQVRHKVYKGSSEAWRKYASFLGDCFNQLDA